ncbi:cytochrome P450 [Streptomyces qinglanensis]|uniref:cytochrome P450 n=1 Tax=Streptomyces qinglanensis TaxID=943816 RepID=UPI0037BA4EC8
MPDTHVPAPPSAPGALPLLGHAVPLLRAPGRFLESLPSRGPLVQVRLGPFRALVVCDPELTRRVLVDDRVFDKGGPLFDRGREALGSGILTCPHSTHRRQRRLTQPAFHPGRLPAYSVTMAHRIGRVAHRWQDGRVVDVLAEMQDLTASVTTATMFGDRSLDVPPTELAEDFDTLSRSLYRRTLLPRFLDRLPTPGNRRYQRARGRLRHTVGRFVADCRRHREDRGDLLSMLVGPHGSAEEATSGDHLSHDEVTDQVTAFFIAGIETVAATLAWSFHLLGGHPGVEERLHAEVDSVLRDVPATYEDLPRLAFTKRVVTETLRLYPPVWLLTRRVTTDTVLGGCRLPTGTAVVYSPFLLHRMPGLHQDPDCFDPDRWEPERARSMRREALIPFGGGPRKCMGDTFGMTESVLALATFARRWRLLPVPGTRVRPAPGGILNPRGLRMRTRLRTPCADG